jgi:hypothetical protein
MLISFTYDEFIFASQKGFFTPAENKLIFVVFILGITSLTLSNFIYPFIFNLLITTLGTIGVIYFVHLSDKTLLLLAIKTFYSISVTVNTIWTIIIASYHNYNLFGDWSEVPGTTFSVICCWCIYHIDCLLGFNKSLKILSPLLTVIYCLYKIYISYFNKTTFLICVGDNCLSSREQYIFQLSSFALNFSRKIYHNFLGHNNSLFLSHPKIIFSSDSRVRESHVEI